MKKNLVSIVILDFLKARVVVQNVESILKQKTNYALEIFVVDNSVNAENAHLLRTLEKYKNVTVLINETNEGYTKGNNKGARLASGEFIAVVNPDIVWKQAETLEKLVSYLKSHPDIGVLAPQQVNPDGSVAMSVRAFPNLFIQVVRRTCLRRLPVLKRLVAYDEMRHLNYSKIQSVDWLQSSFIVMRKELWDICGGFNERYFLFMSDAEICWQCWQKKKKVVYYPKAKVYADGIRCSDGGFAAFFKRWVLRQHLKDSWLYSWRHLFEKNPRDIFERMNKK